MKSVNENQFLQQINLTPKSDVRPLYTKVPFFLDFRIYVFNLTNPEEFTEGTSKSNFLFRKNNIHMSDHLEKLILNLKVKKPKFSKLGHIFLSKYSVSVCLNISSDKKKQSAENIIIFLLYFCVRVLENTENGKRNMI